MQWSNEQVLAACRGSGLLRLFQQKTTEKKQGSKCALNDRHTLKGECHQPHSLFISGGMGYALELAKVEPSLEKKT